LSPKSIKRTRKTLKLTQRAAAALVHVSPNTWARWERGESRPRGLHQRRLITALPQSGREGYFLQAKTKLLPPIPSKADKMPHSTGATLLEYLASRDNGSGSGQKRKFQRNPTKFRSASPSQERKFRSTGATLLKYAGTWVGDDAQRCLELVHAARGMAKF